MEELKYSSGSAWRRIEAMQALGEIPELAPKIEAGELSLANVSQVQSFCRTQGKSSDEKRDLFQKVEGLSKRETERVLAQIAPLPALPEIVRVLDADTTELRVTLDRATLEQLEKVRDLLAHAKPGASYAEVIAYLARLGIQKLDPAAEKRAARIPPGETATRRAVWKRDRGVCQYTYQGRKCGARALVQPDHIVPKAKGGSDEANNLILKCRRHNLLAAVDEFGWDKMKPFLKNQGDTPESFLQGSPPLIGTPPFKGPAPS
jgi:hypothetical protein